VRNNPVGPVEGRSHRAGPLGRWKTKGQSWWGEPARLGNGVLEDQAQPGGPPTTRTDVGLEDRKGRESAGEGREPRGGATPKRSSIKSRQGNKQKPKAASERINKSKQSLG